MFVDIPAWLAILLLVIGGGTLLWIILILLTFLGLWFVHPKDAHDDLLNNDPKGKP